MANRRTSWRRAPANSQPHHRRPQKQQAALPFSGVEESGLLTIFTHLLAKHVSVNAVNGAVYTGLFSGTHHSPNSNDLLLTLRYATLVKGKPVPHATVHDLRGNTAARIQIPFSRVTTVLGAPLDAPRPRPFATDAQISRGSAGVGRQLQKFDHFAALDPVPTAPAATLDERTFGSLAAAPVRAKWDQFQVNAAKFGVTTSFDESEYTTSIDRNGKNFAERQREAARLADEIENAPAENTHMREERNQERGADFDEEARYSGVQRPQPRAPNTALPSAASAQPSRSPAVAKDPVQPAVQRMSYAAAAAVNSGDWRLPPPVKQLSAGPTHGAQAAAVAKQPAANTKAPAPGAKQPAAGAAAKALQPGTKTSHDHHAKSTAPASRAPQVATNKTSTFNGKGPTQSAKSLKKASATNAKGPQHHHVKTHAVNAKSSSQQITAKPATQPGVNAKPSTQAVNPKSSAPAVHAKAVPPASSAPATPPPATSTAAKVPAQVKTPPAKANLPAAVGNKDKPVEEKLKPTAAPRERSSRENLPQIVKVRTALTGRTSPNQSRNSPLPTPATADTSAVGVLNLDAQTPNFGPEQIKRFEEYKTNREIQSIAANREKITDDLKKFSTQLDSRNGPLRRGQNSVGLGGGTSGSAPSTPRASSRASNVKTENVTATATDDKRTESGQNEDEAQITVASGDDTPKESTATDKAKSNVDNQEAKMSEKSSESAAKLRPKSKIKLNPNAAEFKPNPEAPSFTPAAQKAPQQPQTPQAFNPYPETSGPVEFSRQMQVPQGYALPMQPMTQMAYGGQPYMVVPAVPTPIAGGGGSAYPFMQQPASFTPPHVAGRFPQSAGSPVSYGYPQVAPMVIGQPPQQRVPNSPYYYNSAPYPAGQAPAAHMAAPQQHMYQQGGPGHMQGGGVSMSGRGGHGNARRGGAGKSRGKHYGQHPYGQNSTAPSVDRPTPKSPEGTLSPGSTPR